jgi:ankyrin repeat protein
MPLHEAIRAGHHEAVDLLVQHGADINYVTLQGYSPLYLARHHLTEDHPITQLLLSLGAVHVGPEL